FQAEDGIRDFHVTGVQTCALPIFIPDTNEINVPISAGINISVGFSAPAAIRSAMTDVGISVIPAVLSTRNMIWAFVAVFLSSFSFCNSFMAFSPTGVAALSRPSIFAEKFMMMEPFAG